MFKINIKKIKQSQKGFTLLESLISIFILTLAITGPIYISSFSLKNTISSRDTITAQYLSEEVIEVLKNNKDSSALNADSQTPNHTDWLENITGNTSCFRDSVSPDNKCVMTKSLGNTFVDDEYLFTNCTNGNCDALNFSSSSEVVYGLDDSQAANTSKSKFTREFYLEKGESDTAQTGLPNREVKVVVNIRWMERGSQRVYTLTDRLYNINYPNFFLN